MSPVPEPTTAQQNRLDKVHALTEVYAEISAQHARAINDLWEAMREARKAGASLGQIRESTKWVSRDPMMGDHVFGPLYTRSRVQQLTQGWGPKKGKR